MIISFSPRNCIANLRPRAKIYILQVLNTVTDDYSITSASVSVHRSTSMYEVMNVRLIPNLARQQSIEGEPEIGRFDVFLLRIQMFS
jgi:hypothetical protein